MSIFIISLGLF